MHEGVSRWDMQFAGISMIKSVDACRSAIGVYARICRGDRTQNDLTGSDGTFNVNHVRALERGDKVPEDCIEPILLAAGVPEAHVLAVAYKELTAIMDSFG